MKYGPFTAIMLACLLFPLTAHAKIYVAQTSTGWASAYGAGSIAPPARSAHRGTARVQRRPSYAVSIQGDRDSAYWLAVRQGGPCGLSVERIVFGRSDHVLDGWNPWRAVEWLGFERAAPIPGMVVVWRSGRHVEVIAVNHGDGTVATRGSVGFARVSLRLLIVVDPRSPRRRYYARI